MTCLAALTTPVTAQAPAGGFESILWLHGGPPRDAAFFAAVKAAGYSAVSVSGGDDPTLPGAHGLGYYHDQLCGKGVLELRAAQYQPVVKAYSEARDDSTLVRPACLSESETLARLLGTAGKRLAATLPHRPWAISLGDEISVTSHANPLDLCFAPASLVGFRRFVTARYRTIQELNVRWGTDFASFGRVRPFTADRIRRRELVGGRLPQSLEPWATHREFMDREFAQVIGALVKVAGRHEDAPPIGLTGVQQPSAYGGHDYARVLPLCSFYEVYDIGGARDLAMCLAPADAVQVATLFAPEGRLDPLILRAQLADLIAHGMSGVVVWSAGLAFDTKGRPTAYGKAMSEALRKLQPVANRFAGATLRRSDVWMLESQASVRAWWMLDSRADGDTWIKRLSSYEARHSTSLAARRGWIRLLEDLGLQPLLVSSTRLLAALRKSRPRVLILPATIALSDAVADAIKKYVEDGGVLLADHSTGLYDERLARRERPALDDLFGIQSRGTGIASQFVIGGRAVKKARLRSGAAVAEHGLRAAVSDVKSGRHLQMENEAGRGRTCYLNMAVCEYGSVRLDPKAIGAALDIRRRVRFVLRTAGVTPPVYIRAKGMPTCLERMVLRARDGRQLLAVRVNALESPELLAKLIKRGPVEIELSFPKKTVLKNLLTQKTTGSATTHSVSLDSSLGLFLEVEKGS
ncbi:MAG: alpha-amylase family protein [Planctomycetota bacterium]|nr:alpha-amylase family protein [Planctomycetota bacterium]